MPAKQPANSMTTILAEKAWNFCWESLLGISTRGEIKLPEHNDEGIHYYNTTPYRQIRSVVRRLNPGRTDTLVDFGCGLGRAVCVAATFRLRRIVGVEYSRTIADRARANVLQMRLRRTNIDIINASAAEADCSEVTCAYLYNPFGENILRQVLERLRAAQRRLPREIRIAYVNPVYDNVFAESGWLSRYDRWEPVAAGRLRFAVTFWRG